MITIHNILRRNSFILCLDGDRHTMFVATSDHKHLLTFKSEITCIDVGRNIYPGKVSDMDRTVRVGQSGRNECSLEFFH